MIKLTKLNNQTLMLNSDLIKSVENAPDTVLTLLTGEKIIVRETADQVVERVIAFRRAVLSGLPADSPAISGGSTFPRMSSSETSGAT
jgi:flagellar protein FlbD